MSNLMVGILIALGLALILMSIWAFWGFWVTVLFAGLACLSIAVFGDFGSS